MADSREWLTPMPDPGCMIRLLRIPESQMRGPNIELSFDLVEVNLKLETFLLDDAPSYKALSYTWGCPFNDPKGAQHWYAHVSAHPEIICNGRSVPVTNSLLSALRCVRQTSPDVWLWNDALCIDQTNATEKIIQINLMGDIYNSANETLVWIAPRVEQKLFFHQYYTSFSALGPAPPLAEREQRYSVIDRVFGPATFAIRAHLVWELLNFGRLSWWKRTWTLQEYALAERCTLMYGELRFDGNTLLEFLELLIELGNRDQQMAKNSRFLYRHSMMFRLKSRQLVSVARQDPQKVTAILDNAHGCHSFPAIMMELLGQTVGLNATDPRDTIFGLVGLCRVIAKHLGQPVDDQFLLQDASATDLAGAFSRQAVLAVPILTVLRFAGYPEECSGMPSWTPDFTRPVYGTLSKLQYDSSLMHASGNDECLSERHFKISADPALSVQPQALGLEAIKVGVIKSTIAVRQGPEYTTLSLNEQEYQTIRAILTFCLTLPEKYWAEHRKDTGLWQTLLCGNPRVTQLMVQVSFMVNLYLYGCDVATDRKDSILDFLAPDEQEKLTKILGFDVVENYKAVPVVLESKGDGRSAFLEDLKRKRPSNDTPNSNQWLLALGEEQIGITTRLCQADDEVWIIRGGEYPFVLRPIADVPGHFRLVGEAYVDGVMKGEMVRQRGEAPGWGRIWLV